MARVTVIGYGNPLRGDDGLGYIVAEHLSERIAGAEACRSASDGMRCDIKVLALHQLTPELADEIKDAELVIFVDANCDKAPGQLYCKAINIRSNYSSPTTHHFDPAALLSLTQELYGTYPKQAILLTVGGESFGYKEGLSPVVLAAMPNLEQALQAWLP